MTAPFYVSPQQVLADRAEYARKGIARGRSIVVWQIDRGILFVAENAMPTLHKVSEIYDRIAFAAVGRYNEFEALRVAGVRRADLTGYAYSREDVNARALAGVYSQTLGQIFTHELKPMEVELLVAEVGSPEDEDGSADRLYRVTFDGQISDEKDVVTMGGAADELLERVKAMFEPDMTDAGALQKAVQAMADQSGNPIGIGSLEVALLDRTTPGRAFARMGAGEITEKLGGEEVAPGGAGDGAAKESEEG
ncbi:MAG: proteasome subunit alpha [Actinobacteria bacterium ATB1]|nr:proteasome subunit alpha [Actinobacteria bacterium ATB1]